MAPVASCQFRYQPPPARLLAYQPTESIEIAGFEGDHVFESIRNTGTFYEIELLESLARQREPRSGVALDVGANIGNHAIYFAKFLCSRVVCVEPSPRAIRLLRMNLSANTLDSRVSVVEAAAGDREGTVAVVEAPPSEMGSSRVRDVDPGEPAVTVPMITLDALTSEMRAKSELRVSLVKVDVEGFEERVLAGGQRLLETDRPVLVLELATSETRDRLSGRLERLGYRRLGPWCWTPTYVFASEWRDGFLTELHYRLWRSLSRGRLSRWSRSWKRTRPS